MTDYSKSVIYMIKKKDDDDNENVYVGSTNDIKQRKRAHKKICNNPNLKGYNMKVYQYIRENGGWDNFVMDVILAYPCNSKKELVKREDEIMCEIKSNLNNIRAKRSIKEWRIDNRDKIKERDKKWYEDNKDKVLEKNKKYRELNKEKRSEKRSEKIKCDICGSEITKGNLLRHKKSLKCQDFVH